MGASESRAEKEARLAADETAEVEDFDAFWSSLDRSALRLNNVFGVDVELPAELPLRFEIEAQRLSQQSDDESTRRMVSILFGQDVLDTWIERGLDPEQLGVLLLWGAENAHGNRMTLAQARDEYWRRRRRNEDSAGKADAASGD